MRKTIIEKTKGRFLEKNLEIFDLSYAIARDRNIQKN
jgi:hypothetical protein